MCFKLYIDGGTGFYWQRNLNEKDIKHTFSCRSKLFSLSPKMLVSLIASVLGEVRVIR